MILPSVDLGGAWRNRACSGPIVSSKVTVCRPIAASPRLARDFVGTALAKTDFGRHHWARLRLGAVGNADHGSYFQASVNRSEPTTIGTAVNDEHGGAAFDYFELWTR
jgi:hypothetical protein